MGETLRASGRLTLAVLASRILGVAREAMFAALFGAGALADAYQVAFRIPNLLRDLFAEGALSNAFVPTFTAALVNEGRERAHALGNLAFSGVLIVTGCLSLLGVYFAEQVVVAISGGFAGDPDKLRTTVELTKIMMPILCLVSLSAVWMGMLNAQKHYLAPAYAPAMFNVVSLVVGAGLWWSHARGGQALEWWSMGTLGAGVVQLLFQLPALWRLGYRPWPRLRGLWHDAGIRRILRLMAPAVVGLAAIQINVFVNTHFASALGDGPVAWLTYAFRLFYLPIGMFGVALATVTVTRVAEDAARGDREGLAVRTAEGLGAGWMLTSASTVGLWLLADPVVALIYERGAFTAADTVTTANVLRAYLVGLVPYTLVKLLAPAFYSVDKPRLPLLASVLAVVVNVTFNALTYRTLGAMGIALGTSLGAFVNWLTLRSSFHHAVGASLGRADGRQLVALALANVGMGGVVYGMQAAWSFARAFVVDAAGQVLATALGVAWLFGTIGVGFMVLVMILGRFDYPGAVALGQLPRRLLGKARKS